MQYGGGGILKHIKIEQPLQILHHRLIHILFDPLKRTQKFTLRLPKIIFVGNVTIGEIELDALLEADGEFLYDELDLALEAD